MNTDLVLQHFAQCRGFVEEAMKDVPDERMAEQFPGLPNHPAWTMTHLAVAHDFANQVLGGQTVCPKAWNELANPGTTPVADRSTYAAKNELMTKYGEAAAGLEATVRAAEPDTWGRESPEFIRSFAPTLGHLATYMLAAHDQYHLGQLMCWRRAAGLLK